MKKFVPAKKYMNLCFALAKKACGRTSPNPLVGAVIVKNNTIIGQGYHTKAGAPHAEIEALTQAGKSARGAVLYVNIEPCCHYGKTPPCTEMIIRAGIGKVVIAMQDPNPLVSGNGIKQLQEAGISVEQGLLKAQARKLNEVFIKYITKKRPFVVLKTAISLDGRIATFTGDSKWITGEKARNYAHTLRSYYDAVLVGIGTVLKDDPLLNYRGRIKNITQPVRVIVDSSAKIPIECSLLKTTKKIRTIIAVTKYAVASKLKKLTNAGAEVLLTESHNDRVNLDDLLNKLGSMGITSVLVEGGGELNASFINNDLVDKLLIFIAPKIIGGARAVSFVQGKGSAKLSDCYLCEQPKLKRFGQDVLLETYPLKAARGTS
ncbi:MAG: bifunctional diaminohydroxyphosphoribosylaminopyrimidine deaminase/5-amino-6-(5-phosphoribosylamino)uracil reductase RibD [Spirochaetales bacterium]|nr:bifunctional diaminohydroxyphosphoribosylaminopyrimidine deaminase/5-amino-6-(5-phosphoribosylamino)uracil reductase RibD [Spirochaetales bacterium]